MNQAGQPAPRDRVVLVADKNIEAVVGGLLARPEALGIRPVDYDCFVQLTETLHAWFGTDRQ
jgi:hypothetical protein